MAETRYKIVFDGQLMPEMTLETVKENLARLFKSDPAKIDNLFSGGAVALKRDLPASEADKYLAVLQQAGANARKELDLASGLSLVPSDDHPEPTPTEAQPVADANRMSCPKCGHEQAKADECAACGIIIDKFLARQAQQGSVPAAAVSPYATPQAQVGEALPEYSELKVFSVSGRIGLLQSAGTVRPSAQARRPARDSAITTDNGEVFCRLCSSRF
jgi:hypothetical protein